MIIKPSSALKGEISVPGDKSISHRSVMFGSLARGTTHVTHFLTGADCLSTIACFSRMGIQIDRQGDEVTIHGNGLHGLKAADGILDCGNSGTTTRLISGILSGQAFTTTLTGDASIQTRPMKRIMDPLTAMGASITSVNGNGCAPLRIEGGQTLHGIHYHTPVASAQVKSCILLAGMYADAPTTVTEPAASRNHSELMLSAFGANVRCEGLSATIDPEPQLFAQEIAVPSDISSAAYFIAAAAIVPGSELLIKNVDINPTRDGMLKAALAMGADITLLNEHLSGREPVADLLVRYSSLHGTIIEGSIIPTCIDELPMIAIMAAFADGQTIIRNAAELKVKESDRIATTTEGLRAMGADITPTEDGFIINGGKPLHGARVNSYLDHRIAMSFAIAALAAEGETDIKDAECVNISYPVFYQDLARLAK